MAEKKTTFEDIKNALWARVMERLPYHQKRIKLAACQLLAEKNMIDGKYNRALRFIQEFEKYPLST